MRQLTFTMAIAIFTCRAYATDLKSFAVATDIFLKKYVDGGQVDYSGIHQNLPEAEKLYQEISTVNLSQSPAAEKKAFYINAYNIIVIYSVGKHFPVKTVMDIDGFFEKIKHTVAGERLTLNELESKKLLQPYKDGRLHFVLVCAARSCPPLANFAFTADKIEEQLTERTALILNDKDWIKVQPTQRKVALSKIFEWYKDDFKSTAKTPLAWINQFRKEKIPTSYAVTFYEYDWALNKN